MNFERGWGYSWLLFVFLGGVRLEIIDTHVHVGLSNFCISKESNFEFDLCNSYENMLSIMDIHQIEQAVILPIPYYEFDSQKGNEYILEAYNKYPNRFIPFCRIDDNLEKNLLVNGFKGVKVHLLYENLEIKAIRKELQIIEDAGVPIVVHAKFKNKVAQIEEILKYAPNIKIILAHMGRGHLYTGEQVVENCMRLKKYSNVYVDTSTIGDIKSIVNACEIIGYDRVMYGSDYPFGKQYYREKYKYEDDLKMLVNAFSEKELRLVLSQNAKKLFKIGNEEYINIRRVKKMDLENIVNLIGDLSDQDKKFLALHSKYSLIRQVIRSERHCYVAERKGRIVGFLRESGRPQKFSLLEELFVSPECRGEGIASMMLDYYHNIFKKNMAKTNASNLGMIHLLQKKGYLAENPNAPRIINWIRDGESNT